MDRFILNETSYFGRGCREVLPGLLREKEFNTVLVVTDDALIDAGITEKVTKLLDDEGIVYKVYSEIQPNPTIKNVLDGVEMCKNLGAEAIVAVGGGSPMDTAKGISIVIANPERADVKSLNGLSNTRNHGLPLICLPTTHGTSS